MPLVIGGDDSIPPILARALTDNGTFDVVTIDAHLDFRDEVGGERFGRSSPARRMGEINGLTALTATRLLMLLADSRGTLLRWRSRRIARSS